METLVNNTVISDNITTRGQPDWTLYLEVQQRNSSVEAASVDALFCTPTASNGWDQVLNCVYMYINGIIITTPEPDPIVTAVIPDVGKNIVSEEGDGSTWMTLEHMSAAGNASQSQVSMTSLRNDTFAASHYLGQLGANFQSNETSMTYTGLFDTTDIEVGLEIPKWLLVSYGRRDGCVHLHLGTDSVPRAQAIHFFALHVHLDQAHAPDPSQGPGAHAGQCRSCRIRDSQSFLPKARMTTTQSLLWTRSRWFL